MVRGFFGHDIWMSRSAFGELFVDYYLKLKQTEFGRFETFLKEAGQADDGETTTAWEHDEYFDNF